MKRTPASPYHAETCSPTGVYSSRSNSGDLMPIIRPPSPMICIVGSKSIATRPPNVEALVLPKVEDPNVSPPKPCTSVVVVCAKAIEGNALIAIAAATMNSFRMRTLQVLMAVMRATGVPPHAWRKWLEKYESARPTSSSIDLQHGQLGVTAAAV